TQAEPVSFPFVPAAVLDALFLGGASAANAPLMNIASAIPCGLLRTTLRMTAFRSSVWSAHRPTRTWWTGEDSNLRSPQGAADLQSAGFSHSPTRPRKIRQDSNRLFQKNLPEKFSAASENTKRTRVKRHQPVNFEFQDSLRLTPLQIFWWSWRRELNPRPSDYKSDALPAELR